MAKGGRLMATCEILDFQCIFVSEIVGSTVLAVILALILYFIIASKMRLGFDTTIALLLPIIAIFGLMLSGFSAVYAFATFVVALLVAWLFNRIIGNR
jgi:asparagine N-glycosylation enzyme membrane subunit Stt3